MLARLDEIPGVTGARVDRSGVLLRLEAPANAITVVQEELRSAGYDATPLEPAERDDILARVTEWYGTAGAAELSGEEAAVLARRITAAFVRGGGTITPPVEALIREELEAAFADSRHGAPPGAAQERCAAAVRERARPLLGDGPSERLGAEVRRAFDTGDGTAGIA